MQDRNSPDTLRVALRAFAAMGLRPERELTRLGVRVEDGTVRGPVPRQTYCALWERMARAAGRADVGLEVARATERGTLGTLEWLVLSARTVGEGLSALARHGRMLHSGGHYALRVEGDEARFTYHGGAEHAPSRPTLDWSFSYLVGGIGRALPPGGGVREVHLQYARPADAVRVEDALRVPVIFDAPLNEIVLAREVLDHPLATRDDDAHAALESVCLARAPAAESALPQRVEAKVMVALQRGNVPSVEGVARALGVSVRSLQRALREHDVSFRELVLRARMQIARRWLAQPGATTSEVAYRLGYSEPSAMARAYRAHFGVDLLRA